MRAFVLARRLPARTSAHAAAERGLEVVRLAESLHEQAVALGVVEAIDIEIAHDQRGMTVVATGRRKRLEMS